MNTKQKQLPKQRVKNLSTMPPWVYDFLTQVARPCAGRVVSWLEEVKEAKYQASCNDIDQCKAACYNGRNS